MVLENGQFPDGRIRGLVARGTNSMEIKSTSNNYRTFEKPYSMNKKIVSYLILKNTCDSSGIPRIRILLFDVKRIQASQIAPVPVAWKVITFICDFF